MKQNIYKGGLQPQEKKEKILIELIGVFLIIILKEGHMDDGTVKAILEAYNFYAGYYLCKLKWCINKYVLKK
jgi:hypothetical protein